MIDYSLNNLMHWDSTLFDLVILPQGMSVETCVNEIIWHCGLAQPVYGDPAVMKEAIGHFFRVHQLEIGKFWDALQSQYNPIENYDRQTSGGRKHRRDYVDKNRRDGNRTEELKGNVHSMETITPNTTVTNSGIDTTTNDVSAFNESGYQADTQSKLEHGLIQSTTGTSEDEVLTESSNDNTITDIITDTGSGNSDDKEEYNERVHGNIGVTTTQQMLEQEINLYNKFNIYQWIANKFENELMLTIW